MAEHRSFISNAGQEFWEEHLASIHAEVKAERHDAFLEKMKPYKDEFQVKANFIFKGLFEPCEDAIFEKGILVKINGKAYRLEGRTMLTNIYDNKIVGYLENDEIVWM
jgi:hypothetical protein